MIAGGEYDVVVMLANEIENGKEKCYNYWPEETPSEFELLSVVRNSITKAEDFLTREFTITDNATNAKRQVRQLQYTAWPDQGLPENTAGFRNLVAMADQLNTNSKSMVIHCSAGIGRTGVFCVVHNTMAKLKLLLTSSVDVGFNLKDTVLKMREQRAGMVQTEEQYVFCYMSLLDKVQDILTLISYKNERWFHKNLDSNQANDLLLNKPHGAFLFRASSVPGFIVLSAVSGKNVLHARIAVSEKGFELETDTYPSLTKLVQSRSKVLMHPILRLK